MKIQTVTYKKAVFKRPKSFLDVYNKNLKLLILILALYVTAKVMGFISQKDSDFVLVSAWSTNPGFETWAILKYTRVKFTNSKFTHSNTHAPSWKNTCSWAHWHMCLQTSTHVDGKHAHTSCPSIWSHNMPLTTQHTSVVICLCKCRKPHFITRC